MKYRWKEKELLKGLKNAVKNNDPDTEDNFNHMLSLLQDMHITEVPEPDSNPSYESLFDNYRDYMEYISDEVFDRCTDIFKIVNDEDEIFTQIKQSKINLSNHDLVSLGHEIIEELNDSRALQIYQEITRNKNHYLHIVDDDREDEKDDRYGVTIFDHVEKKSYIMLKRRYTPYDIETFIHEIMHAILYKHRDRKYYMCNYFEELEGKFGERLTSNFLRKHEMDTWADELDAYNLYENIYKSYMLYLNDILFYTSKNHRFNTTAATKMITEETPFKDTYIDPENIPYICNMNGFATITNIIDYMICLELSNKYPPEDQFAFIKQLSKIENYEFYNGEIKTVFDFYKDNNKQMIEEKNRIDKKIRVLK